MNGLPEKASDPSINNQCATFPRFCFVFISLPLPSHSVTSRVCKLAAFVSALCLTPENLPSPPLSAPSKGCRSAMITPIAVTCHCVSLAVQSVTFIVLLMADRTREKAFPHEKGDYFLATALQYLSPAVFFFRFFVVALLTKFCSTWAVERS